MKLLFLDVDGAKTGKAEEEDCGETEECRGGV